MTMKSIAAHQEDSMQSVLAKLSGYRHRTYDEECRHCSAAPGEACRNSFNPTETYTAGHLVWVEPATETQGTR